MGDGGVHVANGRSVLVKGETGATLRGIAGHLAPNQVLKFVNDGAWTMGELLAALLEKTGPAKVRISSVWMDRRSAIRLLQLVDAGIITELHCVLEKSVGNLQTFVTDDFMQATDRRVLRRSVANLTIVESEKLAVSVTGGGSYSHDRRMEMGTIFTTKADVLFDQLTFDAMLERGNE